LEIEEKHFFFEKKKQKTFITLGLGRWAATATSPESKSFWFAGG
jgi:hypothetical protein